MAQGARVGRKRGMGDGGEEVIDGAARRTERQESVRSFWAQSDWIGLDWIEQ